MQTPLKITVVYAAVALGWILFSDQALYFAAGGSEGFITLWQSIKGFLFVLVTALCLFLVLRFYFQRMEKIQEEKRQVFESTVDAAAHILNNFLNDMIYFRMVAEDTPFIDSEVLDEYDRVIRDTSERLNELSEIEDISVGTIRAWMQGETTSWYCEIDE